ncbi:MAG: antibiotic biosynthesis monooxygenase, partial [Actinobacteria bacterium]|nr:antibiotic biosynthesis monooxygenase [Actinomycetota bacterium]
MTTEYDALAREMSSLAESMPGFVSEKTFASADGERV